MRHSVVLAVAAGAAATMLLAGCGGVDRAGTKQKIIDGLQGQGLTTEQITCVSNTVDKFTDDELKQLDASTAPQSLQDRVTSAVMECASPSASAAPEPSAS